MASIEWKSETLGSEFHELRLELQIENFIYYIASPKVEVKTSPMDCTKNCGATWVLGVLPYDNDGGHITLDFYYVYLKLVGKPYLGQVMQAYFEIYVLGNDDSKLKLGTFNKASEKKLRSDSGFYLPKLLDRSQILNDSDRYLPNGHLTIRCEGRALLKKPHQASTIKTLPQTIHSEIILEMYQKGLYSDVILKSGSIELKCHKNILARDCKYFKAMFSHEMLENRENVVDLTKDLNGEELKALRDYIYLGEQEMINFSQSSLKNLFRVSDMYGLNEFQKVCETALIRQLKRKNAPELLTFSDKFGAKRLKKEAACIIIYNSD